jgi:predicted kinase
VCSTAGACSKREVGKDNDERQESESSHSHEARAGDVPRSLRFDAGDGRNGGDEYCEAKPREPAHDRDSILRLKAQATTELSGWGFARAIRSHHVESHAPNEEIICCRPLCLDYTADGRTLDVLIILAGLPGTGKTTIARELARQLGAMHVRIDSIERAVRDSGVRVVSLDDAGYRVAYAVAEDNLRLGHTAIADSVNPLSVTRNAWVEVANRAGVDFMEVEITCSDREQHRRRVETRTADIPGLRSPTWPEIIARDYEPWDRARMVIDTAHASVECSVETLRAAMRTRNMGRSVPREKL